MELSRRQLLKGAAGGLGAYSVAEVIESVVIGYGPVVGTNLIEQAADGSLAELARAGFGVRDRYEATVDGVDLRVEEGERLTVEPGADGERVRRELSTLDREAAAALDERFGLEAGPIAELARDLPAVRRGDVAFSFCDPETLWERLDGAAARPFTVGAVRGPRYRTPEPGVVEEFVGADPARTSSLVEELATAFRERTSYDVPRYLAGAVYFNLLFGTVDVRAPFRSDVSMEAIAEDGGDLFCQEYTWRSIEAFHAVPAHRQSHPVLGGEVIDTRHKHVYTMLGGVVREDGRPEVVVTFLDYMHSTLYDDFALRGVLGDGVDAFGERHRATDLVWGH
jgi:hypothetical protein